MVTRKPVPSPSASDLPYPTTPPGGSSPIAAQKGTGDASTSKDTAGFDLIDMDEHHPLTRRDSDVSSHGTWDSDDADEEEPDGYVEVPKPLNIQHSQQDLAATVAAQRKEGDAKQNELPAVLRPGPGGGRTIAPRRSQEMALYDEEAQDNPWRVETNNPYLRQNASPEHDTPAAGRDLHTQSSTIPPIPWSSGQDAHQPPHPLPSSSSFSSSPPVQPPPAPSQAPPAPPVQATPSAPPAPPLPATQPLPPVQSTFSTQPPVNGLAGFSISGQDSASASPAFETAEVLPVPQQGQPPFPPVTTSPSAEALAFPSNNPWRIPSPPERSEPSYPSPADLPSQSPTFPQSQQAQYEPPPGLPPGFSGRLIDHEEPASAQSPQQQPPRPAPIVTQQPALRSSDAVPETPGARAKRQRNEHYQIKHVNWFDRTAMRQSPILTQNANGPCPLLALVNALVLSTPPNLNTALVDALKTREQVSLGLLLDAVFDELMSGRRGDTAHELPDVSELYSFLLALHTGMNVNPRFVTQAATPRGSFDGHPPELHGVHPMHRSQEKPGCFEETREMRLYSTFNVPLIHGWTPAKNSAAYTAFERNAQTFEDAQNIQFLEPELEDKQQHEGLGAEELQSLQDIRTMKQFLANWPTQLTEHGLETISASMAPGQIAILFRNDHFSTLYKEPQHGALMTLVTDAGYGSHAEIVWESLVDVNGAASEMFSGDFRLVSHAEDVRFDQTAASSATRFYSNPQPSRINEQDEVPPPLPGPRPSSSSRPTTDDSHDAVVMSDAQRKAAEQEDHDLALALQLQEEEEDRQRQDDERRQREQQLSEQFLENEERPPVPPRRSGVRGSISASSGARGGNISSVSISGNNITSSARTGRTTSATNTTPVRPGVNRPVSATDPDAPPSYEQAASDQVYRPAGSTAPPTQGSPLNAYDALRRQQSAYSQQSTSSVNAPPYSASAAAAVANGRRRSDANRTRRRSSAMGNLASASTPANGDRVWQAATVRDTQDERCVVM